MLYFEARRGLAHSEAGSDVGALAAAMTQTIGSCKTAVEEWGWGLCWLCCRLLKGRERVWLLEERKVTLSNASTARYAARLPQLHQKGGLSPTAAAVSPTILPQQQVPVWLLPQWIACLSPVDGEGGSSRATQLLLFKAPGPWTAGLRWQRLSRGWPSCGQVWQKGW